MFKYFCFEKPCRNPAEYSASTNRLHARACKSAFFSLREKMRIFFVDEKNCAPESGLPADGRSELPAPSAGASSEDFYRVAKSGGFKKRKTRLSDVI